MQARVAAIAQGVAQGRVGVQTFHGGGQGTRITGIDQQPGITHHLGNDVAGVGDHRCAVAHRLQQDQPETLDQRGEDEPQATAVEAPQLVIGHVAEEADAILGPLQGGADLPLGIVHPASDAQLDAGTAQRRAAEKTADQGLDVLGALQLADVQEIRPFADRRRQPWTDRRPALVDDPDPLTGIAEKADDIVTGVARHGKHAIGVGHRPVQQPAQQETAQAPELLRIPVVGQIMYSEDDRHAHARQIDEVRQMQQIRPHAGDDAGEDAGVPEHPRSALPDRLTAHPAEAVGQIERLVMFLPGRMEDRVAVVVAACRQGPQQTDQVTVGTADMVIEIDGIDRDMHTRTRIPLPQRLRQATRALRRFLLAATLGLSSTACSSPPTVRVDLLPEAADKAAPARVYGFGGNIWHVPEVFDAGVADSIHNMGRLGITRVSLGDLLLEPAESEQDLHKRLAAFPLNDFLRRYAAAGGNVLFILDGVPSWLSSNLSRQVHKGPDLPVFRLSPPADLQAWSRVVEAIVRHFNGRLGLDAYYEVWNEPNFYYLGDTEQFLRQYYHTVVGARRADPKAKVGGPSVSDFLSVGTAGTRQSGQGDRQRLVSLLMEQKYLFRQFLDYAGRTPVPELGLKRLPVDFFSWHAFYIDPTRYYDLVVPVFRKFLAEAGYPAGTPIINTEWNIADVPPYPEGDLNATEVGAAFAATSLMAMRAAGVDGQIFQMYVDPGTDGYYGGMFTVSGIPRANFHAFRLFTQLRGTPLRTRSSDPWVRSVAFRDGDTTYLLVSSFVPTARMISETQKLSSALESAALTRDMADQGLAARLAAGKGLPGPYAERAREISERNRREVKDETDKATRWRSGVDLEIHLGQRPKQVRRLLIDADHSNVYRDLAKAREHLLRRTQRLQAAVLITERLRAADFDRREVSRIEERLRQRRSNEEVLEAVSPERRERLAETLRAAIAEVRRGHREALEEISAWPSARLHEEAIEWPRSGPLRLRVKPYTVQLFVISGG